MFDVAITPFLSKKRETRLWSLQNPSVMMDDGDPSESEDLEDESSSYGSASSSSSTSSDTVCRNSWFIQGGLIVTAKVGSPCSE